MGNNDNVQQPSKYPVCDACQQAITSKTVLITTCCSHSFHKTCLSISLKTRPFCPVCSTRIVNDPPSDGVPTRSKNSGPGSTDGPAGSQNTALVESEKLDSEGAVGFNAGVLNTSIRGQTKGTVTQTNESLREMITCIVSAQQAQLFATLSTQISNLEAKLNASSSTNQPQSVASLSHNTSLPLPTSVPSPPQMHNLTAVEQQTFRDLLGIRSDSATASHRPRDESDLPARLRNPALSGLSTLPDLNVRPDKVLQIISNWRIKFSGGLSGLSVDNFIYRVEALTSQTLQGDFDLLCNNACLLFEGKASVWFWRYHRSVASIRWPNLCLALRKEYRDSRTDVDYREMIRDRKQKPNETFDTFYESIVDLTDRLREPIHDDTLVEILRRNLLPEIQHEILNLQVSSVQHLRDICRRREFFMADIRRKHGFGLSRTPPAAKRISEIETGLEQQMDDDLHVDGEEISEINLICWNCQKSGHRYQDCLSDRTVFCYGCGTPDTYKPNCKKCHSKNVKYGALKSALKSTKPKPSETEI